MGVAPAEPTTDNRRFDILDALGQIAPAILISRPRPPAPPSSSSKPVARPSPRRGRSPTSRTSTGQRRSSAPIFSNRDTPTKFLQHYRDKEVWTNITVRAVLYSFWKWRFDRAGKDFPRWLKIPVSARGASRRDPDDVLTPEEVARIAEHAINLRDKALIGVRTGKTGRRTVPLFEAGAPNRLLWLKNHPRAEDRNAPLWVQLEPANPSGTGIGYRYVVKLLERSATRAGVEQPVNPHSFRHSRATSVAQNPLVSTSVLAKFFGWQPGSPMAKTYVHLAGNDVEDALVRAHGIELGKVDTPRAKLPCVCPRGSTSNDPDGKFCVPCGAVQTLEGAEERVRWKREEDRLADLLDDPKIRAFMARRMRARLARSAV